MERKEEEVEVGQKRSKNICRVLGEFFRARDDRQKIGVYEKKETPQKTNDEKRRDEGMKQAVKRKINKK